MKWTTVAKTVGHMGTTTPPIIQMAELTESYPFDQVASGGRMYLIANERQRLLGRALDAMYESISFPEGGEPDWKRMQSVFHRNARFVRVTPEAIDYLDMRSFQAMALEMLDRGVYTSFFENEIARRVEIFGSIAHVLSAYETKRSPEATSFLARGVNSIQLLWDGTSWRVLNLTWDEESDCNFMDIDRMFAIEEPNG
jgi:hypothetical protein